jgi:DNA repair exonuclease SbcCD ATPase subunit
VAFNTDPRDAVRISDLIRKMEKHESNGRNARWQATQANKKIEELLDKTKNKKHKDYDALEEEYNKLHKEAEKKARTFENIKIEYDSLTKSQAFLYAELSELKREYAKLFARYSKPRSKLLENTEMKLAIKNHECIVCGSMGSTISDNIQRNLHKEKCPLCNTVINEGANAEQDKLLKQIQANDKTLEKKNSELEKVFQEIGGKKKELDRAEIELEKIKEKFTDFTEDYPDISFKRTGNQDFDNLINQYKAQFDLADQESKEEYLKRDKLKPEYDKLLKKVEGAYKEAEKHFVPIFKQLAKSFIGLDLNIQPKRTEKSIKLVLELQKTARTESFQLSESQRFFLDIALRMSLAIFLSKKGQESTLLIDTPEGSLDIAYESRVGNMFAEFATTYAQNILMTANINASQLLVSLAQKCGRKKMKFRRMLDWTDLSEIQKQGENLFKRVYSTIETALNKIK